MADFLARSSEHIYHIALGHTYLIIVHIIDCWDD